MIPSCLYSSPSEAGGPELLEINAHFIVYCVASPEEQAILLYKVDVTEKDVLGFYTLADVPDEDLVLVQILNADLKYWLIFYGVPEPGGLEWWTVVVNHRARPIKEKCAAMYYRYAAISEELFPGETVVL
ncbi:hypothetical protein [Methanolobus sp.]|uniref:hypothetical protein n=1 Tax=Methanolobus sp. TaxID=1874737 RepID=UPI0025FAADA2|nr:hypothetical protein [Methanolobus sp.]